MHPEQIRALPKVVLHEHLDGGLRPETIIELARDGAYRGLPSEDPAELASWFDQSSSGSLERYLDAFDHTIGVMQTEAALERVAREAVHDLAADGVVYAEIRFAPSLHCERGLERRDVIAAVMSGLDAGTASTGMRARVIVDAMRQSDDSLDVAEAATHFTGRGVVGFDLAGPEAGYPPSRHLAALRAAVDGGLRLTIHAGEADGVASIAAALDAGAERLGHGVRIVDDCILDAGEVVGLGPTARRVYETNATLEICPTSNLGTGAFSSAADHPIGMLARAGLPVTVNTDNRLMSRTTMSGEMGFVVDHHGFVIDDLRGVTDRAVDAAFCDEETRTAVRMAVAAGYDAGELTLDPGRHVCEGFGPGFLVERFMAEGCEHVPIDSGQILERR